VNTTKSKKPSSTEDLTKKIEELQGRAQKLAEDLRDDHINDREYSTLARTAAGRLRSSLQMIAGYGPNLSCAQVASLLTVAMFPGRNLGQLAHLASLPKSTMSRHMLDLSAYRRSRKGLEGEDRARAPGLGLIDVVTPPDNMRERHYTLTQRGSALINILETILAK
jgi:DNA-binding MarR family transcriptional regulator